MVTAEKMMSVDGQHALQDMVELEMYLLAQSRLAPWSMLPRRGPPHHSGAAWPYPDRHHGALCRRLSQRHRACHQSAGPTGASTPSGKTPSPALAAMPQPAVELADIFRQHGPVYRQCGGILSRLLLPPSHAPLPAPQDTS